jgi:hypothetical protein
MTENQERVSLGSNIFIFRSGVVVIQQGVRCCHAVYISMLLSCCCWSACVWASLSHQSFHDGGGHHTATV